MTLTGNMSRGISIAGLRWWLFALFLSLGPACSSQGRTNEAADPSASIEKTSKQQVWEPDAGGTQVPLWPEDRAIRQPDTGGHPEEVGPAPVSENSGDPSTRS